MVRIAEGKESGRALNRSKKSRIQVRLRSSRGYTKAQISTKPINKKILFADRQNVRFEKGSENGHTERVGTVGKKIYGTDLKFKK